MTSFSPEFALFGLPPNLIVPVDGTVPLLAKMVKLGLNRDHKREIGTKMPVDPFIAALVGESVSDLDARMLSYYVNPIFRNVAFWMSLNVDKGENRKSSQYSAVRAPELVLLREYDPDFRVHTFDEQAFLATCDVWPRLHKRMAQVVLKIMDKIGRGTLMVWPKICGDLARWDELEDEQRITLANAVFSMMTLLGSAWFVREGVRRCPGLEPYLAPLYEHPMNVERGLALNDGPQADVDPSELPPGGIDAAVDARPDSRKKDDYGSEIGKGSGDDAVAEVQWALVLDDVTALVTALREGPQQDLLEQLSVATGRLESLAPLYGRAKRIAQETYCAACTDLETFIAELTASEAFDWLDATTVGQLFARWKLALRACASGDDIAALASDVQRALVAGADVSALAAANDTTLRQLADEIGNVKRKIVSAGTLHERRSLTQQLADLRGRQVELDNALLLLQERLLATLSPRGEAFDLAADYASMLDSDGTASQPAPTGGGHTGAHDSVLEDAGDLARDDEATVRGNDPTAAVDDATGAAVEALAADDAAPGAGDDAPTDDALAAAPAPEAPRLQAEADSAADALGCDEDTQVEADPIDAPDAPAPTAARTAAPTILVDVGSTHDAPRQAPAASDAPGARAAASADRTDRPDTPAGRAAQVPDVWLALHEGRLSLAYQLARAARAAEVAVLVPPDALLASVVLADHIVMPEGAVVAALSSHYTQLLDEADPPDAPDDWLTAVAVLKVAATLRPLLLAPGSGAAEVATNLHLGPYHDGVYQLVRTVQQHSELLQGFRLDMSTFRTTRNAAAWQLDLDALRREAGEWHDQAPHMTMLFSASTKVWQHWLKPGGLLHRLLTPIARNDFADLPAMKQLIAELGQPGNVEMRVQHTDRREVGRPRGEDIQARALVQLVNRVDEAASLARRWIALVEARPQASDALDRKLSALRADIATARARVDAELAAPAGRDEQGLVTMARRVLQRSIDALWNLFDPERPAQPVEQHPEELLGADLLLVPTVDMDVQWMPEHAGSDLLQLVLTSPNYPELAPAYAFEERLARQDLEGSERLLRLLERDVRPDVSDAASAGLQALRERWDQLLVERRNALRRQIDHVRAEVETGVAYGLIVEAKRAEFDGVLVDLETSMDAVRRFWEAFARLAGVSASIAAHRREKTDDVRLRLDELASRGLAPEDIATVQTTLEHGDILTANELLQRLELGEHLEGNATETPDRFRAYFPNGTSVIDEALDALTPGELRERISTARGVANLDYSQIPAPQMRQASDMVNAWLSLKANKRSDTDILRKLLGTLGFEVLALKAAQQIGVRADWELTVTPIEDRAVCPVPYFGSVAAGRYRLVCVWQRPAEEDIIKLVGDSTIQRPTIVLYFGRLTDRKRREASRLAKQQHRSFLLIDETLLISLTAEGGSRLAALFETALPFSYTAPYDPTSSVVATEMFFGRLQELQAIQGMDGRCFMYGGRTLGKTALLRKAEKSMHDPREHRYAKWIDLRAEGIGVNRAPSDIWICIARELRAIGLLPPDFPELNPLVKGKVEQLIGTIKDLLKPSSERRVLLLLDEADRFLERDLHGDFAETRRLKELMEQTERRFKVVFAGLHNVLRMTESANHPLAHLGEPIKVGPLLEGQEWRDAEELIRKPFQAAGFEFESRDLVTRVLAQTNYYPSLIQLYCAHLLRHMLTLLRNDARLAGPRYVIQARHVDAVYKNPKLRSEIREKFNLTLQLDPRYEVIAYTLAYGALQRRHSLPEGVLARDVKARVTEWWPEGFANTSDLEFRVLLDEMAGLGVLREIGPGRFGLRNPNILLLLGNEEEIGDVLLKQREPTQEFDPATFRARVAQDPGDVRRNPLTFQQDLILTRPTNSVTVLSGTQAAGLDDVLPFLQVNVGPRFLLLFDGARNQAEFKRDLERLKDRPESGTTVAVVPAQVPWSYAWVAEARDKVSRLSSKGKHAHVLFLCDAPSAWSAIRAGEVMDWPDVNHMFLSPWQDSFVRQWLEDCNVQNDRPTRDLINVTTGFWPMLLYQSGFGSRDGIRVQERVDAVSHAFNDGARRNALMAAFGLDVPEVLPVMRTLADVGEPVRTDELVELAEVDERQVHHVLAWARMMQLVTRGATADGCWTLDPVVQRLLRGPSSL